MLVQLALQLHILIIAHVQSLMHRYTTRVRQIEKSHVMAETVHTLYISLVYSLPHLQQYTVSPGRLAHITYHRCVEVRCMHVARFVHPIYVAFACHTGHTFVKYTTPFT